ncbi:MAG: hypothetical protein U0X39_06540 [Bacteroidales bacterium]
MKIHHCPDLLFYILFVFASGVFVSVQTDPFRPDSGQPVVNAEGMVLAWNEEFNYTGANLILQYGGSKKDL